MKHVGARSPRLAAIDSHAEGCPITASARTADFIDGFVAEDPVLTAAREQAFELGINAVSRGCGAALRVIAAVSNAKSVVEVGTGTGVSGGWLLRGMRRDGVLTTIDLEAENQRAAREAFTEAGFRPNRTRLITGRALEVLPRLTDRAYDFVLLDAESTEYDAYVDQSLRLLRRGGVLAVTDALWRGKVADPAQRDRATTTMREVVKRIRDDARLVPALLPVGDGLLLAVLR
jgi:predicted O-methyltransferase YrrM